jgi:hypothetical protein
MTGGRKSRFALCGLALVVIALTGTSATKTSR